MILAASTPAAVCLQNDNLKLVEAGLPNQNPFWTGSEVWKYPNLAMLNFQGTLVAPSLGEYMDRVLGTSRRGGYSRIRQGAEALSGMQAMLADKLNIHIIIYLTVGHSWQAYNGLDMHMRPMTRGMPAPEEEAHSYQPQERYYCPALHSYGQRWIVAQWAVEFSMHIGYSTQ